MYNTSYLPPGNSQERGANLKAKVKVNFTPLFIYAYLTIELLLLSTPSPTRQSIHLSILHLLKPQHDTSKQIPVVSCCTSVTFQLLHLFLLFKVSNECAAASPHNPPDHQNLTQNAIPHHAARPRNHPSPPNYSCGSVVLVPVYRVWWR